MWIRIINGEFINLAVASRLFVDVSGEGNGASICALLEGFSFIVSRYDAEAQAQEALTRLVANANRGGRKT